MTLTLPYPPSVNHYWRHVGRKVLISREGRSYRTAVQAAVVGQLGWKSDPLSGRLTLAMRAWMPDRRRRDLDNLIKSSQDAMQEAGVYRDDSQIDKLTIERAGVDTTRPRLEVEIAQL